jgi:hypothetical protein
MDDGWWMTDDGRRTLHEEWMMHDGCWVMENAWWMMDDAFTQR